MWSVFLPTYLHKISVKLAVPFQAQPSQQVLFSSLNQLVKYVEISLTMVLVDHPGLLQQVAQDVTTDCTSLRANISFSHEKDWQAKIKLETFQATWWSNWMSMYFPKRLELSFFRVLAFPKACAEK